MPIKRITVAADYCFGPEPLRLENLAKVNFVFAPNGTGKTTISNALMLQPDCLEARRSRKRATGQLPIRVFNEAFQTEVLTEQLDGIFTFGAESREINQRIEKLEKEMRQRHQQLLDLEEEMGSEEGPDGASGLLGQLAEIRADAVLDLFEEHKSVARSTREFVFKGFRNSKGDFFAEALKREKEPKASTSGLTWEGLEQTVGSLAGPKAEIRPIPQVATIRLMSDADRQALELPLQPDAKGSLADLITVLNSEKWVSQGRQFFPNTEEQCPFCQQHASTELEGELETYFSKEFV